jgi:hypothetical protein
MALVIRMVAIGRRANAMSTSLSSLRANILQEWGAQSPGVYRILADSIDNLLIVGTRVDPHDSRYAKRLIRRRARLARDLVKDAARSPCWPRRAKVPFLRCTL